VGGIRIFREAANIDTNLQTVELVDARIEKLDRAIGATHPQKPSGTAAVRSGRT
jgi:hypothetical protein